MGEHFTVSVLNGGYEVMNSELGQIFSDLGIIIIIPSLYIASKIVKDRPFSSYVSHVEDGITGSISKQW